MDQETKEKFAEYESICNSIINGEPSEHSEKEMAARWKIALNRILQDAQFADWADGIIKGQGDMMMQLRKELDEVKAALEIATVRLDERLSLDRQKFLDETSMRIFCNRTSTTPTEAFDYACKFWDEQQARLEHS